MRKLIENWEKFLGEAKRKDWDSAHAVLIKGKKTLLVQRAYDDSWMPGKWGFAGGMLNKGETLEEGLKREIKEETGYNVELEDLTYLPEISYKKKHAFYACKRCVGKLEINANGVHEHEDAKWIEKSEIRDMDTVPDVKEVVMEAFKVLGVQNGRPKRPTN